jgi:hypothetical protein
MNPRDLFGPGLTIPTHENNDLHYIGEALPAPSLVTTAVSAATPAYVGGSAVPAREDHIHNLEFSVDLTNYYTKAEIDTMLDEIAAGTFDLTNYYTKAEVDSFTTILGDAIDALGVRMNMAESDIDNLEFVALDHEDRIGVLEAAGGPDLVIIPFEKDWSYGHIVNPSSQVFLNRYVAFKGFKISYIEITYVTASDTPTVVNMWSDAGGIFEIIATVTLAADDLSHQYVFTTPYELAPFDQIYPAIQANSSGNGKDITISIRGFYI